MHAYILHALSSTLAKSDGNGGQEMELHVRLDLGWELRMGLEEGEDDEELGDVIFSDSRYVHAFYSRPQSGLSLRSVT
jgi:hypothetical protein